MIAVEVRIREDGTVWAWAFGLGPPVPALLIPASDPAAEQCVARYAHMLARAVGYTPEERVRGQNMLRAIGLYFAQQEPMR